MRESHSEDAILYAARQILKERYGSDAGYIFNKISTNENAASELKKLDLMKLPFCIEPDEVLAFTQQAKMTKRNYLRMRKLCIIHHAKIWPPWPKIQKSKQSVLPSGIQVNDFDSIIPMQPLLNKTSERILIDTDLQSDIKNLISENNFGPERPIKLRLFLKYGFDGSSNQSMYNQKPTLKVKKRGRHNMSERPDDSKMVASQITVIWLAWGDKILYLNEMMNSAAGCRPLCLRYGKETPASSREEWARLKNEIRQLTPYFPIKSVQINFDLVPTMFDVKAINDIQSIASYAKPWACGKNPTQFPLDPGTICIFLKNLPFFGVMV